MSSWTLWSTLLVVLDVAVLLLCAREFGRRGAVLMTSLSIGGVVFILVEISSRLSGP